MDELYEHLDNLDPEWKKTKEYKKFLEMDKTTKEAKEAAMKLKRETIANIAQLEINRLASENTKKEVLLDIVADFDIRMKAILAELYMESRKILDEKGISKDKTKMNRFSYLLVMFVSSIDELTGRGGVRAQKIFSDFPELENTNFGNKLKKVAQSMDELAKAKKEYDMRKEANERLKKLFGELPK